MGLSRKFDAIGVLALLTVACTVVAGLAVLIPGPPARPIGDGYQVGTGEHRAVVVKVEARHQFPDGTVREGWLMRADDGVEVWFPRDQMKKAELVRR